MSALTELLPAATLRPSPLLLPLHRRVSVRQRRRREHRKNLRMLEDGLLLTSSTRVSVLPPFPFFQNSTVLLNRSEVRLGGRGPEAGHGLGGRVDERRKLLDSEKHREPEGDHGRKGNNSWTRSLVPHSEWSTVPERFGEGVSFLEHYK